jgi:hypothetical protein
MVAPGPDDYYWLKRRIVVTAAGAFHLRGGCQQRIVVPFKFRVTQVRHLAVPNGLPEPVVSGPGVTASSRNIVVADDMTDPDAPIEYDEDSEFGRFTFPEPAGARLDPDAARAVFRQQVADWRAAGKGQFTAADLAAILERTGMSRA